MSLDTLKNDKKVIGIKQVTKAIEKDVAELVYIAEDAETRVVSPIQELCSRKKVPMEKVLTMSELGKACGIEVGASAVAVVKKA